MRFMNRRRFLRGAGGIALALPTLEIMLNRNGTALAGGSDLPRRYMVCFHGSSYGGSESDGPIPSPAFGPDYDITPAFAGLQDHDVRDDVTLVTNLRVPTGDPAPPGGIKGPNHLLPTLAQLTGTRHVGMSRTTADAPSSDQIAHEAIGGDTKSLVYRVQAGPYHTLDGSYRIVQGLMSFREESGEIEPVQPFTSPRQAFNSLFMGFSPPSASPAEVARLEFEIARDRSVLDFVLEDRNTLLDQVGSNDRQRVDAYFTALRSLEQDIAGQFELPPGAGAHCEPPGDPGPDPEVEDGYSQEDERARIFVELIHMAFVCDAARTAALQLSYCQSSMFLKDVNGVGNSVHGATHNRNNADVATHIAWGTGHFARLIAKLRDTPEGDGSVLDSSGLVFLLEMGKEGRNPHSARNMIALLGGRAGGIRGGLHIDGNERHPSNVLRTAMTGCGVPGNTLGEVEGVIGEALA